MILPICILGSTATRRRLWKINQALVCGPLRIPSQSQSRSSFWIDVTDRSVTGYEPRYSFWIDVTDRSVTGYEPRFSFWIDVRNRSVTGYEP